MSESNGNISMSAEELLKVCGEHIGDAAMLALVLGVAIGSSERLDIPLSDALRQAADAMHEMYPDAHAKLLTILLSGLSSGLKGSPDDDPSFKIIPFPKVA